MFDYALIDQCKNKNVPSIIVKAIIQNESLKNPLAINVNHKGKSLISYKPKNKKEAFSLAKKWIDKGFTVDIGLMQFNSANLKKYPNHTIRDMLDPCNNIKVSSTIYYKNFLATNKKESYKKRVLMSLSAYNTGSFKRGFKNGYVAKYKKYLATYLNIENTKDSYQYAKFLLSVKAPTNLIY